MNDDYRDHAASGENFDTLKRKRNKREKISIEGVQRNCTALRRMIHEGESPEEGDWKHRGRVVSTRVGLAIRRSRVRVPLSPLAGFVLGRSKFKSLPTLVNSQLVASCQLGFLILLCCI